MKVLTIVAHPREESLTMKVTNRFIEGLQDAGHTVEFLDLYRHKFEAALPVADEPIWDAEEQHFSPEVTKEMKRMKSADALAFIFPLWWWNMPAIMKGYIDRVWNFGFAYGNNHLHHEHVLWIGIAAADEKKLEKRKYDSMMEHYFNVGLADYCGITSSTFHLLTETNKVNPQQLDEWLKQAYELGRNYGK